MMLLKEQGKLQEKGKMEDKIASFIKTFEFSIATTQQEKETLRRLRHQVFVEELDYQLSADTERKLEYDQFEDSSIHCFITHKRTGLIAGCMRLVTPMRIGEERPSLPLEGVCTPLFNHASYAPSRFQNAEICEVSRFAVPSTFRHKRRHDRVNGNGFDFQLEEKELFPMIMIGLFLTTFALVGLTERPHVFAMMQPNLPRALSFSGFHFTKITDTFEHFGTRGAFYINHERATHEFKKELTPLYVEIKRQLRNQLPAAKASERLEFQKELS
ncbi:PEP-CTERM/exosortase system-associated acyltransferase [Onishia taeanensis]